MNKAFIFDRSGTLSDNFHGFCQVCGLMLKELGKEPISPDDIRKTFTLPYMKFRNAHVPELTKERQDELFSKHILTIDPSVLYEGAFDVLHTLHKAWRQIFVVSSDNLSTLLPDIERAWLAPIFSKVIGQVHEKKEELVALIEEFDLDKEHTFYVWDTSWDVEAGKYAGVKTVWISRWYQDKERLSVSKPDYLIETIEELLKLV